jgi:hypothetical protein
MKLSIKEIETLIDWYGYFECNDLSSDEENNAIEIRNEKLRLKLVKEYKKLKEGK